MKALLLAAILALSISTATTAGGCSPVRTTRDGYVCSHAAYAHWAARQ